MRVDINTLGYTGLNKTHMPSLWNLEANTSSIHMILLLNNIYYKLDNNS